MDFREALQAGKIGIGAAGDHWSRLFGQKVLGGYAQGYAEGAIASFSDGAKDAPVDKLLVEITPVQTGTGDPSPENIRPISGWTGCNVQRTGKNLVDPSKREQTSQTINRWYVNDGFLLKKGITYTLSANDNLVGVYFRTVDNVFIKGGHNTETYTPTEDISVLLQLYKATNIQSVDIQLEVGATATAYKPYQGTTYPITFPSEAGTVYGGELDVTSGVLTVDFGYIDLGVLTWDIVEDTSLFYADLSDLAYGTIQTTFSGICTSYKPANSRSNNTNAKTMPDKTITNRTQNIRRLYIMDTDYNDASTFQTAMNGVYLAYPLATPLTYHLTPTEVTTLLGVNNLWADTGDVKVWYKKKK